MRERPRPMKLSPLRPTSRTYRYKPIESLVAWLAFSALMVCAGFLLDPITVIGHHALLIGGGGLAGWKLRGYA